MKTFKQELIDKFEEHKIKAINIDKEMETIKTLMKENFLNRSFTVHLIVSRIPMAIGCSNNGYNQSASFFVPKGVEPWRYQKLFVDKFKELGFNDTDIERSVEGSDDYDFYNIELSW